MKSKQFLMLACSAFILVTSSCKKDDDNSAGQQVTYTDVSYGSHAQQKMDIYLPATRSTENTKVAVLVHGGAWTSGDKADFNDAVAALKTQLPDYAIANINYRLATLSGSNLWPAQNEDVASALNFLISESSKYQYNAGKIALIGASAGAHLAMLQAYGGSTTIKSNVKAVVDLFGPTNMVKLYDSYANDPISQAGLRLWLNGTPTTNFTAYVNASPIQFLTAQAPPTIIFHGTADLTVPIGQSDSLNNALTSRGIVHEYYKYTGEGHGWTGPNLLDTYSKAVAFIKKNVP